MVMDKKIKFLRIQVDYYRTIPDKTIPVENYCDIRKDKGPYVYFYSGCNEFNLEDFGECISKDLKKENISIKIECIGQYIDCYVKIKYKQKVIDYKLINSHICGYFKKNNYTKCEKRKIIFNLNSVKLEKITIPFGNPVIKLIEKNISRNKVLTQQQWSKINYDNDVVASGGTGPFDVKFWVDICKFFVWFITTLSTLYEKYRLFKEIFSTKFDYPQKTYIDIKIPVFRNVLYNFIIFVLSLITIGAVYPILKIKLTEWQLKYITIDGKSLKSDINCACFYKIFYKSLLFSVITVGIYFPVMYRNIKQYLYSSIYIQNNNNYDYNEGLG